MGDPATHSILTGTSSAPSTSTETRKWANNKRIILCADGTWIASDRGDKSYPSNVAKLARAIATTGRERDPETGSETELKQVVFYQSGLGSGPWPLQRYLAGGFGWGLDDNVCQMYDFISNNYDEGDELFFFGFSRGAFTVRSVAGLVSDVGVLSADQMSNFPGLWAAYRSGTPFKDTGWYKEHGDELQKEKVPIKVVGVWDTVGALGIPEWFIVRLLRGVGIPINKAYEFHNTRLSENIEYAFQALALDERRLSFPPALWFKPDGGGPSKALRQCWFPGIHGNIGGSKEEPIGANTFAWMVDNLEDMLTFEKSTIDNFVAEYNSVRGSMSGVPWGCWPIDSSGGLLGILGKRDRTPGKYKDPAGNGQNEEISASKTCETFHPMVRKRNDQLDKWRPKSLEGFVRPQGAETEWKFTGPNSKFIPEDDVLVVTGKKMMVVAAPDGKTVNYEDHESLSTKLYQEPQGTTVAGSSSVPKR